MPLGKIKKKRGQGKPQGIEARITLFRVATMILSITALAAFAQALKGLSGYLFDKGSPLLIAAGLGGGLLCSIASLRVWKRYLSLIEAEKE